MHKLPPCSSGKVVMEPFVNLFGGLGADLQCTKKVIAITWALICNSVIVLPWISLSFWAFLFVSLFLFVMVVAFSSGPVCGLGVII